ncbi:MAG: hypothetical protein IPJ74_00035 [Saprospiraceae bacterium]|nr:hypothetical protein [Saprospiraceae bacterium]
MKVKHPYILMQVLILMPIAGIILFLILYIIATFYYPGGSDVNKTAQDFSWTHNYWCDLMAKGAKNGQLNPARSIAITAMVILCLALCMFWWLLPRLLDNGRHHYKIVQSSGIISMILAVFIFTNYHDLIINAAVVFGVIALTGIYIALYRSKFYKILMFGIFCMILVIMNAYIYYTEHFILALPLLQKITFLLYLCWISFINLILFLKVSGQKL